MKHFCPAYPRPARNRPALLWSFLRARRSWLHTLLERSYSMHMGELHLPGLDLYMINQPELVRQVLVEQPDSFPKSPLLAEAMRPLLGESIFTTNGAQWRRQRAMMDPAFANARMDIAFPRMLEAVDALHARLAQLPARAECDVEAEMTRVTADIIFRTIFSRPLDDADGSAVFEAFARYQELAPRLMLPALYGLRWFAWPWQRLQFRRAARRIREVLAGMIAPRHAAWQRGEAPAQPDILQAFLEARDPQTGAGFGLEELVDQVAMLFLAGHETSASALTWALHLLANSPEIQRRMQEEVARVIGARAPAPSDMKRLELTWNVFRETLRLFPPVGFMAREAAAACPMRDKQVPAGAAVMISPWLIHRHRRIWSEPDAFDPDRHADNASREQLRTGYLPFGMGQRVCLGANFALQEAALILAGIVARYTLAPVPGHVPEPVGRLTIRSANGVRLILERRIP